jgi:chorismate mutase
LKLQVIREEIDRIDEDILTKLDQRLGLAHETRRFKTGIYDPERERRVLERLEHLSDGFEFLRPEFVAVVFREIFQESRRIQEEEGS